MNNNRELELKKVSINHEVYTSDQSCKLCNTTITETTPAAGVNPELLSTKLHDSKVNNLAIDLEISFYPFHKRHIILCQECIVKVSELNTIITMIVNTQNKTMTVN